MLWTCLCCFFKFVVIIFFISTESDHSQALSVTHSVTAGFVETFSDISYMTPIWVVCRKIIYNYNQWPLERVFARSRFQMNTAEWFYGAFLCIELTHDLKNKIRPWTYGQILTWNCHVSIKPLSQDHFKWKCGPWSWSSLQRTRSNFKWKYGLW